MGVEAGRLGEGTFPLDIDRMGQNCLTSLGENNKWNSRKQKNAIALLPALHVGRGNG